MITFSRMLLNTSRRFIYTFAPALSRFLGVPLTSITSLIAINQSTSVLGIVFAPLGDRFGYKILMLCGLASLTMGMFAAGLLPTYAAILIAVVLAGLGKSIFDPAIQAYVAHRVPFERRGLVIGIMEFAWAGSTVVGIPVAGLVIDKLGWQAAFIGAGALSLGCLFLLLVLIPNEISVKSDQAVSTNISYHWKSLFKNRAAVGALGYSFFVCMSNDILFVVYATWLETSFQLTVVALGIGTSIIGAAEIVGEIFSAGFTDRIGLKKGVIIGLGSSTLVFLILPFLDKTLALALFGLFLVFLCFEFTMVTSLSLCTEILPESRATMMSAFFAAAGLGRGKNRGQTPFFNTL